MQLVGSAAKLISLFFANEFTALVRGLGGGGAGCSITVASIDCRKCIANEFTVSPGESGALVRGLGRGGAAQPSLFVQCKGIRRT